MGRPRRPFGGQEEIEWSNRPWMADVRDVPLGVRQETRWAASGNWTYRVPNGQYDPMTYMFVLDAVVNIDPSIELRSGKLAEALNQRRQQLRWDAVTVGKVLSDLCDAFGDVLGAKLGLLERSKDQRGTFYLIRRTPEVARVFTALREELMRATELEMAALSRGEHPARLVSPLLECPSVRKEWVDVE